MYEFDLNKKNVLITGGGGFLAKFFAESIIKFNGNPILIDFDLRGLNRNEAYLNKKTKKKIQIYSCDLTDEKKVFNLFSKLNKSLKSYEVLINNAAPNPTISKVTNTDNSLENFSLNTWQNDINNGLTTAFLCTKYFLKSKNKKQENILNISSDLGIIAPNQDLYRTGKKKFFKPISYSVMKHGIIGLTKYCSTYTIKKNVRCNAIALGGVKNNQPDIFIKKINKLIPLGRMARKDEYGASIIYMISDASSYMNGSVVTIDGGRTSW